MFTKNNHSIIPTVVGAGVGRNKDVEKKITLNESGNNYMDTSYIMYGKHLVLN